MVLGYYVRVKDGRYLKIEDNLGDLVKDRKDATEFEDQFSAEYMADMYDFHYTIEELRVD